MWLPVVPEPFTEEISFEFPLYLCQLTSFMDLFYSFYSIELN